MIYIAYFDGSCNPNPEGKMGVGVHIHTATVTFEESEDSVYEYSRSFEPNKENSNNVAEYMACIKILEYALENLKEKDKLYIKGDSKLVIDQMNGIKLIQGGRYANVARKCQSLMYRVTKRISLIQFTWIPREENTYADTLSKN